MVDLRQCVITTEPASQRPAWPGLLLAGAVLGGCVTVPAEVGTTPETPLEAAAPEHRESGPSVSGDALYLLLEAELARWQGDLPLSFRNYLAVAKESGDPAAAERAVHLAMSSGDTEGGLEAVALWSELAPGSLEVDELRALLLVRAGALDDAAEVFRGVVAATESGSPGEGLRRVSEILLRDMNSSGSSARTAPDAAIHVMQKLVADRSGDPRAHFALGHFLAALGEFDRAERAFERVLGLEPDNEHATVLLARIHQQRDDLPRALAVLERALESKPGSNTFRTTYARLLVDASRFDEARVQFERLLEEDDGNEDLRYAFGLVLFQLRAFDRAEEEFRRLTQSIERRDGAWYYLGRIAEVRRSYEAALDAYDRVDRGDNRMNAQIRIALLLSEAGRVDEARARLHALHGRSTDETLRLYRVEADILLQHSRHEEAMQVYDTALEEWPGNAGLLYARGMLAVDLDDLEVAESDFSAIIERDPNHANALNALGYTLADRTNRIEEAYRLIERAYALEPDNHYIVDSMGWVMFRMGRLEEALYFLRRAMQLGPDPEIAAHLGEVLWMMGEEDAAREVWGSALDAAPDDENLLDVKQRFGL